MQSPILAHLLEELRMCRHVCDMCVRVYACVCVSTYVCVRVRNMWLCVCQRICAATTYVLR